MCLQERLAILQTIARKMPLAADVDLTAAGAVALACDDGGVGSASGEVGGFKGAVSLVCVCVCVCVRACACACACVRAVSFVLELPTVVLPGSSHPSRLTCLMLNEFAS